LWGMPVYRSTGANNALCRDSLEREIHLLRARINPTADSHHAVSDCSRA
jgi:hypothetical protein